MMNKRPERYPPQNRSYEPNKPERATYDANYGAKKPKSIYYDIEVLGDNDSFDLDEHFEDEGCKRPPIPAKRYWQNISLQDIVDLAPLGAKLSDIVLGIHHPRHMDYVEISFNHVVRDQEAEEEQFQKDMRKYERELAKYQTDLVKYQADLADYEVWQAEQELKEAEDQVSKLRAKVKK